MKKKNFFQFKMRQDNQNRLISGKFTVSLKRSFLATNIFILLFFFCTSFSTLNAQNIDSLRSVWQDNTQDDTTRLQALNSFINYGYLYAQPDSANFYAQLQYNFAEAKGQKKYMGNALNLIGLSYLVKSEFLNSLAYHRQCLKLRESIRDSVGIANSLNSIGVIYKELGDYPNALSYYQRSIRIHDEIGELFGSANALSNIGSIYILQEEYLKGEQYLIRAMKKYENIKDIRVKNRGVALCLNNLGWLYKNQENYPKALDYFKRSLKLKEEAGNMVSMLNTINNIGDIYILQGQYSEAIRWCQKSLDIAGEVGALTEKRNACGCLYEAYKSLGNSKEALNYYELMKVLDDSLQREETAKQLQQMEFQKTMLQDSIAKAEEKRLMQEAHDKDVRKKKRARNVYMVTSAFVLLLATGIYGRLRYTRRAKAAIQIEKDRSEHLLLNILPEEIAQELKEKGRADARDFDTVSILFTDFKGFTETSSKLSASELVGEINHCFEAFDYIIEKYRIEKIKTIGDAYMAAGGLPVPTDVSVKNTVLAALDMQEFIRNRKAQNESEGKPAFEMRVGIHTGPVVAGIVGVKKFQFDIWGDTVNTANRMESNGEAGKVNISQDTRELLKHDTDFTFEPRGKVEVKGKGEIEMWFVSRKDSAEHLLTKAK